MNNIAYIGLGSNLADPHIQLLTALDALKEIPKTLINIISGFYLSSPYGPITQPDFINAVVSLSTTLNADELLSFLQKIEINQGRIRHQRWGPRTLDLDLLLFNDEICDTEHLILPHPGLLLRNFVIIPLAEIAPQLMLPNGLPALVYANMIDQDGLTRLTLKSTHVN